MAKQAADLCTGGFDQRVVYEAARRGILERQLPMLRAHYQAKRDVMVEALRREFGGDVSWPAPRGGFFLWATLPGQLDAEAMIERAVRNGVIYVAGEAFFVNAGSQSASRDSGRNIMRLAFSAPIARTHREGVVAAGRTVREELAALTSPAAQAGRDHPATRSEASTRTPKAGWRQRQRPAAGDIAVTAPSTARTAVGSRRQASIAGVAPSTSLTFRSPLRSLEHRELLPGPGTTTLDPITSGPVMGL